jgi:hypothetical protein
VLKEAGVKEVRALTAARVVGHHGDAGTRSAAPWSALQNRELGIGKEPGHCR